MEKQTKSVSDRLKHYEKTGGWIMMRLRDRVEKRRRTG